MRYLVLSPLVYLLAVTKTEASRAEGSFLCAFRDKYQRVFIFLKLDVISFGALNVYSLSFKRSYPHCIHLSSRVSRKSPGRVRAATVENVVSKSAAGRIANVTLMRMRLRATHVPLTCVCAIVHRWWTRYAIDIFENCINARARARVLELSLQHETTNCYSTMIHPFLFVLRPLCRFLTPHRPAVNVNQARVRNAPYTGRRFLQTMTIRYLTPRSTRIGNTPGNYHQSVYLVRDTTRARLRLTQNIVTRVWPKILLSLEDLARV